MKIISHIVTTQLQKGVKDDDMLNIMHSYEPTLEDDVLKEEEEYKSKIAQEIEIVQHRDNLKDIEKSTWIKNLNIMKQYRIQRANK